MNRRRSIKPDITFVNLIDVCLVLLIIFMMTAPALQDWVDVKLPVGKTSNANISEGIVLTVAKDGNVYLDKEQIKIQDFQKRFTEIWDAHKGEPVYIRGDESIPYGTVMEILGVVKNIGGEDVGLVVEDRKKNTGQ